MECTPRSGTFGAVVTDSLGNPLPVETAWLIQGEQRRDCKKSGPNSLACESGQVGPARLFVAAGGNVIEHALELDAHASSYGGCIVSTGSSSLSIVYDGPRCNLSQLVAIRGELFNTPEQPIDVPFGSVTVESSGGRADCRREAHRFTCPATSAASGSYTVVAEIGSSRIERKVSVQIANCQIASPAELKIVRSERMCANDDRGVLRFGLTEGEETSSRRVLPDRVRVRQASSDWVDCQLAPAPQQPGPRPFLCPATSATGGGVYKFEIQLGARIEHVIVTARDNGCSVRSGDFGAHFHADRVCSGGKCVPSGELLNAAGACSLLDNDPFGIEPCARRHDAGVAQDAGAAWDASAADDASLGALDAGAMPRTDANAQ